MKKALIAALAAAAIAAAPALALADGINVLIDGEEVVFDVAPQLINDRTMVPVRAIFEALGAEVDWNGETRTVTSGKDGTSISLAIDSNVMYVNDSPVELDQPACIVDGRTLVPVRAISEAYGVNVTWDSGSQTVYLTNPAPLTGSAFDRVASAIINKGTYDPSGNEYEYKVSTDTDEYLSIAYDAAKKELFFYHAVYGSDIYKTVGILLKDNGTAVESIEYFSVAEEKTYRLSYYIYKDIVLEYNCDFDDEAKPGVTGKLNEEYDMFSSILKGQLDSPTLAEMGVSRVE